jgi:flagellar biosynthetic protein FliQ
MWESYFVQLAGQGLITTLVLAAPALAVGLAAGLLTGMLQTLLQIHDPMLSFVPKIVAVSVTMAMVLPWMAHTWMEYSRQLWTHLPFLHFSG